MKKKTFWRASAVEEKSAKQCVYDVNVKDCSQTLAVFLSLRFTRGVARRVGEAGEDNVRQILD